MRKVLGQPAVRAARWVLLVMVPIAIVVSIGAASASGGAFTATSAIPNASGHTQKVIVLLRQRARGMAGQEQAGPLAQTLRAHGAKRVAAGSKLPFVVASVSRAQETALAASPAVKAVLPDAVIPSSTSPLSTESNPFTPFTPQTSSPATVSAPDRKSVV